MATSEPGSRRPHYNLHRDLVPHRFSRSTRLSPTRGIARIAPAEADPVEVVLSRSWSLTIRPIWERTVVPRIPPTVEFSHRSPAIYLHAEVSEFRRWIRPRPDHKKFHEMSKARRSPPPEWTTHED